MEVVIWAVAVAARRRVERRVGAIMVVILVGMYYFCLSVFLVVLVGRIMSVWVVCWFVGMFVCSCRWCIYCISINGRYRSAVRIKSDEQRLGG